MKNVKKYFYLFPSALLFLSVLPKFYALISTSSETRLANLGDKIIPIAILELLCLTLFVIPRTMKMGFFLICSYLGGAIAVGVVSEISSPIPPAFILILFWIGIYFKESRSFFID